MKPSVARSTPLVLALSALMVLIGGCAAPAMVDLWRDPSYQSGPMRNVLMISLQPDAGRRRIIEDTFVTQLGRLGAQVTPSYREFPTAAPDTQQVIASFEKNGYDGVLVSRALPSIEQTRYVRGYTTTEPITRRRPFQGAYRTVYREVYHEGYTETDRVIRIQVEAWATQGEGRLVWSGTSEIINPGSFDQSKDQVIAHFARELSRSGVVPSGGK